jgi:hypothetical protein
LGKIVAALAAAAVMAGCAGSHNQFNPTPSSPNSVVSSPAGVTGDSGMAPDGCRHVGIIHLTPCSIKFTSSHAGPVKVVVSVQNHIRGTVVEHNDCGGAAGVAKISRKSNYDWMVTAGSSSGDCEARFVYYHNGHKDGWAELRISNSTSGAGVRSRE